MKPANEEPRDARDTDAAAGPDTRPTSPPTQSNRPVEPADAAAPSSRVPPTASIRDLPSVDVPVSPERGPTAPKTRPSGASDDAPADAASLDAASPHAALDVPTAAPSGDEDAVIGADEAPNDRGTTMQSRVSPFARAAATAWEARTTNDDAPLDVNTTQRSPNSDLRAAPLVRDDGRTALLEERVDALEVRLRLAEKSATSERGRVTVALVIAAVALVIAVISLF